MNFKEKLFFEIQYFRIFYFFNRSKLLFLVLFRLTH
ncbi:hypothetical protein H206_09786 [Candidatus Electrothrix aarhusensis]|uniref:Uncharacterized protein n=1 Tax=Candidatus Electrothrix aarhusensis TaxID=1859131 RepID=A0A444J1V9_9BACT|nr:hypothetical protein H206_09786 [Candidatus Electrothrix aarhusensis]